MSAILDLLEQQKETNIYLDLLSETVDLNRSVSDTMDKTSDILDEIATASLSIQEEIEKGGDIYTLLEASLIESNKYLKIMSGNAKDMYSIMKNNEDDKDVGTTSGFKTKNDKEDSKGLLGGLFSFLPKGGLLGGVFSKAGKMLASPKFFGKLLGEGGIKGLAEGVSKWAGPIALIGASIYEFTDGLQNTEKIIGKTADEATDLELVGSGLAGALSGLTLGLIDAKTMYQGLSGVGKMIKDAGKSIYNMLPEFGKGMVDTINYFFFDKKNGLLGGLGEILMGPIRSLSKGNYLDAITGLLTGFVSSWYSIIKRGTKKIVKGIAYLFTDFDWGGFLSELPGQITDATKSVFSSLWDGLKALGSSMWKTLGPELKNDLISLGTWIKDTFMGIFTPVKEAVIGVYTTITDTFNMVVDTVTGVFKGIWDFIKNIPSMIGDSIKEYTKNSTLGKMAGSVMSFFSGDDEEKPKEKSIATTLPKKKVEPIKAKKDTSLVTALPEEKTTEESNVLPFPKKPVKKVVKRKKISRWGKYKTKAEYESALNAYIDNGGDYGYGDADETEDNVIQLQEKRETTARIKNVPKRADGKTASNYSKMRLEEMRQKIHGNQQPIVVNNVTQGNKQERASVPRRHSVDDLSIGLMNAGALDG